MVSINYFSRRSIGELKHCFGKSQKKKKKHILNHYVERTDSNSDFDRVLRRWNVRISTHHEGPTAT